MSSKICAEVDRGILSPAFASQMQGYPPEALEVAVRLQSLVQVDSAIAQGKSTTDDGTA